MTLTSVQEVGYHVPDAIKNLYPNKGERWKEVIQHVACSLIGGSDGYTNAFPNLNVLGDKYESYTEEIRKRFPVEDEKPSGMGVFNTMIEEETRGYRLVLPYEVDRIYREAAYLAQDKSSKHPDVVLYTLYQSVQYKPELDILMVIDPSSKMPGVDRIAKDYWNTMVMKRMESSTSLPWLKQRLIPVALHALGKILLERKRSFFLEPYHYSYDINKIFQGVGTESDRRSLFNFLNESYNLHYDISRHFDNMNIIGGGRERGSLNEWQ